MPHAASTRIEMLGVEDDLTLLIVLEVVFVEHAIVRALDRGPASDADEPLSQPGAHVGQDPLDGLERSYDPIEGNAGRSPEVASALLGDLTRRTEADDGVVATAGSAALQETSTARKLRWQRGLAIDRNWVSHYCCIAAPAQDRSVVVTIGGEYGSAWPWRWRSPQGVVRPI